MKAKDILMEYLFGGIGLIGLILSAIIATIMVAGWIFNLFTWIF